MNVFKRIGLIALAVLVGVGSLFITMPSKKSQNYASADTTTLESPTFYSSDIMFAFTPYYTNSYDDFNGGAGVSNSINYYAMQSILQYSFALKSVDMGAGYSLGFYFNGQFNDDTYLYNPTGFTDISVGRLENLYPFGDNTPARDKYYGLSFSIAKNAPLKEKSFDVYFNYLIDGSTKKVTLGCGVDMSNRTSDFPSLNMVSVEIGSTKYNDGQFKTHYYNVDGDQVVNYFSSCNIVKYTDTHGYEFYFYIPCYISESNDTSFYYSYRKYLLSGSFDFSDNSYYQQGLSDGYNNGYATGERVGYESGSSSGYETGYQAGRIDGIEDAGEYTFLGLIGAVVDAPVSVFKSMFNFNLLGVNLKDFFLAILTFCGITMLIRFALAKG